MMYGKYALLGALLAGVPIATAFGAEPNGDNPFGVVSSTQPSKPPTKAGVKSVEELEAACDRYGPDFIYIPRAGTCIHIGGILRVNGQYVPGRDIYNVATGKVSQTAGAQDTAGLSARANMIFDARTNTDWGTLQSYINMRLQIGNGIRNFNAPASEFAPTIAPAGNGTTANVLLDRAFINIAGFTAGKGNSNFSTIPPYMFGPLIGELFGTGIKQVAYTHELGGGFSGIIALESKGDYAGNNVAPGNAQTLGPSAVPYATSTQYNDGLDNSWVLVGGLRNDGDWGFLQGNLAVTNNTLNSKTLTSAYDPLVGSTSLMGWGATLSGRYLMPFIKPGDEFRAQVTYSHGIIGMVAGLGALNNYNDPMMKRGIGGIITVPQSIIPTTVTATGAVTGVGQSDAFGVTGLYTHYWSPEWRSNFDLGYMRVMMPTAKANGVGAGLNTQEGNANLVVGGVNLIWSPSRFWDIGIELDYLRLAQTIQNPDAAFIAAGMPGLKGDVWSLGARLQRRF